MLDGGEELDVGGEAAPEGGGGGRAETEGEFALEHEDGGADEGAVGEEFEDEGGGDLRGRGCRDQRWLSRRGEDHS